LYPIAVSLLASQTLKNPSYLISLGFIFYFSGQDFGKKIPDQNKAKILTHDNPTKEKQKNTKPLARAKIC